IAAIAACGAPAPSQTPSADQRSAPARALPRTVRVAVGSETDNLSTKLGGGTNAAEYNFLNNSPLVLLDERGVPSPLLASEQPSRDNGTWVVNADGTMETTWRIRSNARWHDGEPVVARDFQFALRVYLDDAMPISDRMPEMLMTSVTPVDDKTFVIAWKQPYPKANLLIQRDLEPLPVHIVGSLYAAGDPDAFLNNRFWSSPDYVGTGPYRLVEWDPGAQLVYQAFDGYFMGPPPIEQIVVRIIPDTNTVVANLLSGDLDTAVGATVLGQQGGATVRERWNQTGEGTVIGTPVRFRDSEIQIDAAYLLQRALLDLRVRRAIATGVDRQPLAQVVTPGESDVAEIYLIPTDPLFAKADSVITKYPYDPARAASLLADAGWTRRGDTLVNSAGEPFTLDIRTTQNEDNLTEMHIMAADLTKLGMDITETVVPQSRIRDSEYRIKFPGVNNTAMSIGVPDTLRVALSAECPDPARRYSGSNRGCWSNPQYDRFYEIASTSLDPS